MNETDKSTERLLAALHERAKELNCLYRVDEILSWEDASEETVFRALVDALPPGWQYPEVCQARISIGSSAYQPEDYRETPWSMHTQIFAQGEPVGDITVLYTQEMPPSYEGPFLKEELRLINAISERIGLYLIQKRLRSYHESWQNAVEGLTSTERKPWAVLLDFLQQTDPSLLQRITRKMINHLCWNGVAEANALLQEGVQDEARPSAEDEDENRPQERHQLRDSVDLTRRTFEIALRHLREEDVVRNIQAWINEENSTFLIKSLENPGTGLAELADAVRRFQNASIEESELSPAVAMSLRVALLRRFFVDQLEFINVAKKYVEVKDFYDLVQRIIYPSRSQGKLGGKGAGLFLAVQVIRKSPEHHELFKNLKVPKTWYVASDGILDFIQHNNLNEVYNRKYMEIERVRQDYPHIIQLFKNSEFTSELVKGLSAALDDFEDRPLIVRSSSMLEDRVGSSFSGKYKSLFVANRGTKKERLDALLDAIAEVYASVFGPDPIEYRAQRGLLDFREEMGIMIEEVVGTRVGKYFFPAFSGVAFSNNEFRWSPRIKLEDGLVRMVPGLGTRAVDRLGDDYPVLMSPGQPGLRINVTADEIERYSPKKMDVINLEKNVFETVDVRDVLREYGDSYPGARRIVSLVEGDRIREPRGLEPDWQGDDLVVTFESLFTRTPFIGQIQALLTFLREKLGMPVDIEFAHDGQDLYLLQCRSQSGSEEHAPAPIPRDLPRDKVLFTAHRYVTNGRIPNITHLVYVNPEAYGEIPDPRILKDVARAVGKLNTVLPKRQFILMGPGRWGSRGDIKLGVGVTYSDINNTAILMEIARRKGNYVPELSFGTHFFQDLVESDIRYLPLYPDEEGITFNELFFTRSRNILPEILPQFAHVADTVRVIDVPKQTGGNVIEVLMNADLDEAVGILGTPGQPGQEPQVSRDVAVAPSEDHWRWRMRMARRIARLLDPERFEVQAIYIFGSTKNGTAGPKSDIDLLVHVRGDAGRTEALTTWLDGWSRALAEMNYLRTGYATEGLLDVHLVTDEDIARKTSYAAKIGAVTDSAKAMPLGPQGVLPGDS
jgi:pyruvate,water dikinase